MPAFTAKQKTEIERSLCDRTTEMKGAILHSKKNRSGVASYAHMIRLDMAWSLTEPERIVLDEIADPAAELARLLSIASQKSLTMPYSQACRFAGAYILQLLQQIVDNRAKRRIENENF